MNTSNCDTKLIHFYSECSYDAYDDRVSQNTVPYHVNLPGSEIFLVALVESTGKELSFCSDSSEIKLGFSMSIDCIPSKVIFLIDGQRLEKSNDAEKHKHIIISLNSQEIELFARASNILMYLSSKESYPIDFPYDEGGRFQVDKFLVSGPIQLLMQELYNHYVQPGTFPAVDLDRTMQELNHRDPSLEIVVEKVDTSGNSLDIYGTVKTKDLFGSEITVVPLLTYQNEKKVNFSWSHYGDGPRFTPTEREETFKFHYYIYYRNITIDLDYDSPDPITLFARKKKILNNYPMKVIIEANNDFVGVKTIPSVDFSVKLG